MGGASSRTKGHDFERHIARLLRVSFPDARRGLQYKDPRECDVEETPFRIECKRLAKVNSGDITQALMQVKRDGENHDDHRPQVVITKADRREALVHMTLDTLLTIVERHFWKPLEDADIIHFPDGSLLAVGPVADEDKMRGVPAEWPSTECPHGHRADEDCTVCDD